MFVIEVVGELNVAWRSNLSLGSDLEVACKDPVPSGVTV